MNDLRTYDPAVLERQYRAGVLTSGLQHPEGVPAVRVDVCPRCACAKSGDMDVANTHADWCEDDGCACHDETLPR